MIGQSTFVCSISVYDFGKDGGCTYGVGLEDDPCTET